MPWIWFVFVVPGGCGVAAIFRAKCREPYRESEGLHRTNASSPSKKINFRDRSDVSSETACCGMKREEKGKSTTILWVTINVEVTGESMNYLKRFKLSVQGMCQFQYHSTGHCWVSSSNEHLAVPLWWKVFGIIMASKHQMAFSRGVEGADDIWERAITIRSVALKSVFFNHPACL